MIPSVAKEANVSSVGNNRVCSNRRSRENKYGSSEKTRAGAKTGSRGSFQMEPLRNRCYESKLKKLSNEITLVLSNTRKLNRVSSTK